MHHLRRARVVPTRNRHLARRLHVEPLLHAVRHDEHLRPRIKTRDHHQHVAGRIGVERADRHVVDHPAIQHRPAIAPQNRRERRRTRRLQDQIGEVLDRRAILRAHEFRMKTERLTQASDAAFCARISRCCTRSGPRRRRCARQASAAGATRRCGFRARRRAWKICRGRYRAAPAGRSGNAETPIRHAADCPSRHCGCCGAARLRNSA